MTVGKVKAQDPQLTQFYSAPIYLNPGFMGATGDGRAVVNYRNQWYKLPANFRTMMASFDTYFPAKDISVGMLLKKDELGANTDQPIGQFDGVIGASYLVHFHHKVKMSLGLQVGGGQFDLNYNHFVFGDQLSTFGHTGNNSKEEFIGQKATFLDVHTGFVLYSPHFWTGMAFHHVNKPEVNVLGSDFEVPMKFSLEFGYVIPLEHSKHYFAGKYKRRRVTLTMHYKHQGGNEQLSIGVYTHYDHLMAGVWYRGLPIKMINNNIANNDAVAFMGGVHFGFTKFTYSYDLTVSELPTDRAGSHEISLSFTLDFNKDYKKKPHHKKMYLPCPVPSS